MRSPFFVYPSAVKTIPSLLTKGILYAIIAFVLNRTIGSPQDDYLLL